MTAPGPYASRTRPRTNPVAEVGTVLWALLPLLTCGLGAPIAFGIATAKRFTVPTLAGLVAYTAAAVTSFGTIGSVDPMPLWLEILAFSCLALATVVATSHLFVIRPAVFSPRRRPQVPIASLSGTEAVDRARRLREQARQTVQADPMLAKRLGIGRPDLNRQFDDGGLVDLNHAPLHVLSTLPGVTEAGARSIRDRVDLLGPFAGLGEVLLEVEISPTFEHHLREYVVFIP